MNKQILSLLIAFLSLTSLQAVSQEFSFSPAQPEAGDEITFTFKPSANMPVKISATEMRGLDIEDLNVETKRSKGVITATLKTSPKATFVFFTVLVNKVPDNNKGEGYFVEIFENGKPKKDANLGKSYFYQYYGEESGIDNDRDRALVAAEREIQFHPDNRSAKNTYLRLLNASDKEKGSAAIQNEIAITKAAGLITEDDYSYLGQLYGLAKNTEEAKTLNEEKKRKFPEGKWVASEFMNDFYREKDLEKKKSMLAEMMINAETKPNWELAKTNLKTFQNYLLRDYINSGDWAAYKEGLKEYNFNLENAKTPNDYNSILYNYNSAAWKMQETGEELALAKELMEKGMKYTKDKWDATVVEKKSEKIQNSAKRLYGMMADTYARVLLADGQAKDALGLAKEVAFEISEGKNEDYNNTYALIAAKTLKVDEYKKDLEGFVKTGKATAEIKDILKAAYTSEKGSEDGFDAYISELEQESRKLLREELLAKQQNKVAPKFNLANLEGNQVSLEGLNGKVVIVDFWATWCGPCIASFPGMKMTQEKYKDNPNVKFLFVNSWETGENIDQKVADFIKNGNYPFEVLMDKGDKVIGSYGVSGIPTKFILDGEGNIRFTSVGFGGSADKLVEELSMMIEIASEK